MSIKSKTQLESAVMLAMNSAYGFPPKLPDQKIAYKAYSKLIKDLKEGRR